MSDPFSSKIEAFVDGELDAAEMRAMDAHLRECPACSADVVAQIHLKRAVKFAGMRYSNSDLRSKVQHKVSSRTPTLWPRWLAVPILAVLLISMGLYFYRSRTYRNENLAYSELTDLHVATLASANPVDVISTDRHTVKPWFQGKIPFTFNLPELANTDFTLLGGRVTYLDQAPGAQLIYQIRKHEISVFIFQDRGSGVNSEFHKNLAFNLESWSYGGLRYYIVGDTNEQDISRLTDLLKAAAKS